MAHEQVGVVVPVHNGARFLSQTLESIRDQGHPLWEVVVVDDGSKDASAAIASAWAQRDPRFRLVRQPHRGVSAARNLGFCNLSATIEAVAFLDADDLWLPQTLEILLGALDEHPGSQASYGLGTLIDADGCPLSDPRLVEVQRHRVAVTERGWADWPTDSPTRFEVMLARVPYATIGTMLFRVSALRELASEGLFEDSLRYFEDWDVLLRLCLRGDCWFEDAGVLLKRCHDANTSSHPALWTGLHQVRARLHRHLADDPQRRRLAWLAQRWGQRTNRLEQWAYAQQAWRQAAPKTVCKHLMLAARALLGEAWFACRAQATIG